jgi:hypothetical protein
MRAGHHSGVAGFEDEDEDDDEYEAPCGCASLLGNSGRLVSR